MDLSGYMNQNHKANFIAELLNTLHYTPQCRWTKTWPKTTFKPGLIFCLKNIRKGKEAVRVDDNYPLAPPSWFMSQTKPPLS